MLYALFLLLSILYNVRKFSKEKPEFLRSLTEATTHQHREMILSHHFHIFIFEAFLAFIVSHLITEGALAIGILGLGFIYILLLGAGFVVYQYFLKFVEKATQLELRKSFNQHVVKEFRVSFALILLPILLYSVINWTFQDEANDFSLLSFFTNIIFVSVLTITCTVIIMLKLIPNREITEPEYLEVIKKRLNQIGMPNIRIRWIETDIKNAFVVGIKLLKFSNQTMFIGRSLRNSLSMEELDAVICHEAAHLANGHVQKRVIELLKNFITASVGFVIVMIGVLALSHLYFGEDVELYQKPIATVCFISCIGWVFFSYSLLFDTIRSHEYEADAYAVMKMGASFEALKSSLEKLTKTDEMPEYLKSKTKTKKKNTWFSKIFSTHPELSERMSFLQYKIRHHLPFNYYVSTPQKIRASLSGIFQWKVAVPLTATFVLCFTWSMVKVNKGHRLVRYIENERTDTIIANEVINEEINSKPFLVGKSLMYHVVKKQKPRLIDHFLKVGADPGRTLIYLAETKNFPLFESYFKQLDHKITQDQYFLVLHKSASVNFTEGYRYLVNSEKFDHLSSDLKADIAQNHRYSQKRTPASANK